jgi:hypothetical protein
MSAGIPETSFAYNNSAAGLNTIPAGSAVAYGGYAPAPVAGQVGAPAQQAGFQLDEETTAEIETRLQHFLKRRPPVLRRQVIKVPGPAGRVQQVVRRIPTPQPDVIEKVYVVKPQRDVVNLVIERPGTPPPQIKETREVEPPHRPVITQQVVKVAPRTQIQQQVVQQPQVVQQQPQQIYTAAPIAAPAQYPYGYPSYSYSSAGYSAYGAPEGGYGAYPTSGVYQSGAYNSYQPY